MARRVLFVLRGKLGDTILAFATVRAWADAYPGDDVSVLVRADYAPMFAGELGLRVLPFGSRLAMFARAAWMRLAEPPFDALMVLLGYGPPIERLGRMVRAERKVYGDARFAATYPEWPQLRKDHYLHEPAWAVAAVVAPELPLPRALRIGSLAVRREPSRAVGIAPVADEARRTMSPDALRDLAGAAAQRHPGAEVRILVNRGDRWVGSIATRGAPQGTVFREFRTLPEVTAEIAPLEHLYATDTGLYHLATAMGVPSTVYFGPTQPWKNALPDQPDLARVRLAALEGEHCEEKGCASAACLNHAVSLHAGATRQLMAEPNAPGCLLRKYPAPALESVTVNEGPRRQA